MRSGSATDVPPNFWTTSVIGCETLPVVLRRTTTQKCIPLDQRVEQLTLGRVQDRAERPDVVPPHRQHPPVEVTALDDDRLQVPNDRVGIFDAPEGLECEHD